MPDVANTARKHQEHWAEVVSDPSLSDLAYKVETNARGQLVLSPHRNWHSDLQVALLELLKDYAPAGHTSIEYALATPEGVKAPDVVWMSAKRRDEMRGTGDPSLLAPEICVEVMSESNTEEEMQGKRRLYRQIGATEVWIVSKDGQIRFFGEDEFEHSELVRECPSTVKP